MKDLLYYIDEAFSSDGMTVRIDESFGCTVLRELDKQLSSLKTDYEGVRLQRFSFRYMIVGSYGRNIRWDKITDSDVDVYKHDDKKLHARLGKALRKGSTEELCVISKSTDEKCFKNILFTSPRAMAPLPSGIVNGWRPYSTYELTTGKSSIPNIIDTMMSYGDVYVIRLDKPEIQIKSGDADYHVSRVNSREGMIYQGDKEFYKKLASDNVSRYKKIVKAAEAKRLADKDMVKNIKDAMDAAYDAMEEIIRNPKVDALLFCNVGTFIEYAQKTLAAFKSYANDKRGTVVHGFIWNNPQKSLNDFNNRCKDMNMYLSKITSFDEDEE